MPKILKLYLFREIFGKIIVRVQCEVHVWIQSICTTILLNVNVVVVCKIPFTTGLKYFFATGMKLCNFALNKFEGSIQIIYLVSLESKRKSSLKSNECSNWSLKFCNNQLLYS